MLVIEDDQRQRFGRHAEDKHVDEHDDQRMLPHVDASFHARAR